MKISKLLFPLSLAVIILLVYRIILLPYAVVAGDYTTITASQLFTWGHFSFLIWNSNLDLGWGIVPLVAYAPYSTLLGWIGKMVGDNGILVERVVLWIPFLIVGFVSSWIVFRKLFGKSFISFLAPFLYLCNTYILLIVGGGQIAGIGQAYSLAPLVIFSYIKVSEKPTITRAILTGLVLAVSLMLDLRVTYVTLVGVAIYLFIKIILDVKKTSLKFTNLASVLGFVIFVPGIIAALLQFYWLLPMAIVRQNPLAQLGSAYDSTAAVKYFSFATFENALGLLHPNWPENIFGKVGFMKPEFLLLPILAFSSLFFIKQKTEKKEEKDEKGYVLFFGLLGLVGAFLAKGANDPFGVVYIWLFNHVPGFVMFRDPTKWYLLIALSYSILIPYTVWKVYEYLKRRFA